MKKAVDIFINKHKLTECKHIFCISHILQLIIKKILNLCPDINYILDTIKEQLKFQYSIGEKNYFETHTNLKSDILHFNITRWAKKFYSLQFIWDNKENIISWLNHKYGKNRFTRVFTGYFLH